MKKTYQTLKLKLQLYEDCDDVITASVQDGVGFQWDSGWNTNEWGEIN